MANGSVFAAMRLRTLVSRHCWSGLGVTELSVSPANVAAVKNIIRAVSYRKLQEKANKALQLESSEAVMELYKDNNDLL
jgi:phosphoenolpyruvate-protein kinase (PTS system EI component)